MQILRKTWMPGCMRKGTCCRSKCHSDSDKRQGDRSYRRRTSLCGSGSCLWEGEFIDSWAFGHLNSEAIHFCSHAICPTFYWWTGVGILVLGRAKFQGNSFSCDDDIRSCTFEVTSIMLCINVMLATVLFHASCVNACAQTKTICMVSIRVQYISAGAYNVQTVGT